MSDTSDKEQATVGGRLKRYVRVGGAVGGLAARLAGNRYLGFEIDKAKHARDLKEALGGLKGPLMKVAQILSTVPDILPPEYVEELAELQSRAPSMGWLFVRRRMGAELGSDWQKKFATFERNAVAAASLGQVHRASDGRRDLACKLQYPDMQSAVEADLRQLKLIFSIYRQYDRAIDTTDIHAEVSERLREELDYYREAKQMLLYRNILVPIKEVHVPETIPELCTSRLLTMTWLDGQSLLSVSDKDQEFRNQVAQNMFRAWYVPFYNFGVIHGDPHLGNYSVRKNGDINLLDFGCIRVFDPNFVGGVIDLYRALERKDEALAVHAYETWGFENLTRELIEVLNLWAEFLYAPLLEDTIRPIQEGQSKMYGAQVAAKVHEELKKLGGVKPPREFVLMDRAAIGLGSVFTHLNAKVNWHQMFKELVEDFDSDRLKDRQKSALVNVDLA
jgi:predicted unusual protein kinase regulating ubiquinone biosynthesis (AarF/ABC1/UbiB family)